MPIKTVVTALLLLIAGSDIYASANIAKFPVAIRQTYSDETSTELSCKRDKPCTFTVQEKRKQVLLLEHDYFGYRVSDAVTGYRYWPNSGRDLVISFDVSCQDADLALVQDPGPECRIFLTRKDNGFIADRIEVWPRDGNPEFNYLGVAP